jgi:hypothetical protein
LCNLLFYQQFRRTYFFLPAASPGILQSYRWKISSPYNFSLHFSYYEWNWEFFAWLDVIYILFKVFFFCSTETWTQSLHLVSQPGPLHQPLLYMCGGFFQERFSQSICLGWFQTVIILISASRVASMTGVSQWCLAQNHILNVTWPFSFWSLLFFFLLICRSISIFRKLSIQQKCMLQIFF